VFDAGLATRYSDSALSSPKRVAPVPSLAMLRHRCVLVSRLVSRFRLAHYNGKSQARTPGPDPDRALHRSTLGLN
jgi:hypothetical protein